MAEKGRIWEVLGRSVRWDEVVRHAPQIVDAARVLYEKNRQRQQQRSEPRHGGPDPTAGLTARVADLDGQVRRLQENETQQSALVADMAKQVDALTGSVDALARRVQILLWISGGALMAGIAALVTALV